MSGAPVEEGQGPWRRLVGSFLTLLAGEGAARAIGLLVVLALARALGPSGFGIVVVGASLIGWYALVIDNGTQVATTATIARRPEEFKTIVQGVMGLRLALGLVVGVGFALASQLLARSELNADVYALFAILAPVAAINLRWMVLGIHAARQLAIANVVSQVVLLAGVVGLVHDNDDILRVPLLYAASELAFALAVLVQLVPRYGVIRPTFDLPRWAETLREGAPLMVSAAARGALFSFDLLVIALVIGPTEAGYYGAALKPVQFAGTAVGLFSFSFLASFTTLSGEQARRLLHRSLRAAIVASCAFAVALAAGASLVIDLAFGDAFGPAAVVLAILALRIPLASLTGVYASVLVAASRQTAAMHASLAGGAVNIAGMLIVVPTLGIDAAAAVSCVAAAVILLLTRAAARGVEVGAAA